MSHISERSDDHRKHGVYGKSVCASFAYDVLDFENSFLFFLVTLLGGWEVREYEAKQCTTC